MKTIMTLCILALCLTAAPAAAEEAGSTEPPSEATFSVDCVEVDSTSTPPRVSVNLDC